MAKVVYLAIIALVLLMLVGMISSAFAFAVPVEVGEVKNDHGFFTTEDPIVLTVTVTNNSTERAHFVVSGKQVDMGYERTFSPGIEPANFDLNPGKLHSFSRLMDNRWEGPFQAQFILEGNSLESNLTYTGYGALPYIVHPPSDIFEKQNAEWNRIIAVTSIIGAVVGPAIAVYVIRKESKENKTNLERADKQHKETLDAMKEQVKVSREELVHMKSEKRDERYNKHSRTIARAMVDCWIGHRTPASWSYRDGVFEPKHIPPPSGRYLRQAKTHLVDGYHEALQMYENAVKKCEELLAKLDETAKDFEKAVMSELAAKWPGLDIKQKHANHKLLNNNFLYSIRGQLLEVLFNEISNRLDPANNTVEFRIGSRTQDSRIVEKQAYAFYYYPIDIPGWHLTVAYGAEEVKDELDLLKNLFNSLLNEPKLKNIVESFARLDSELKSVNDSELKRFDEEIYTILDAAQDDNPIGGRKSCDLCKND